jgi:hypothetical protein
MPYSLVRDDGVGGSNPLTPTNLLKVLAEKSKSETAVSDRLVALGSHGVDGGERGEILAGDPLDYEPALLP